MHNIINTSSGQSWSSKVNSPLPEVEGGPGARGYTGGFQTKLMLKVSASQRAQRAASRAPGTERAVSSCERSELRAITSEACIALL